MSTFQRAARPEGAPPSGPKPRQRPRSVDRRPAAATAKPAASKELRSPATSEPAGERLSKRVMQLKGCSRSEAEKYIEGGWVMVDGVVVEDPPFRVQQQQVTLDPAATLLNLPDVTLILHKPSGWLDGVEEDAEDEPEGREGRPRAAPGAPRMPGGKAAKPRPPSARSLLGSASHFSGDPSGQRLLKRHLLHLEADVPLETGASGLLVFTQDWRVTRKLCEDMGAMEHELIADVAGALGEEALQKINRLLRDERNPLPPAKCSVSSSTPTVSKLRFAIKGAHPGLVAFLCERAGLQLLALRRIRLGRVTLSELPVGQWRYLGAHEKF